MEPRRPRKDAVLQADAPGTPTRSRKAEVEPGKVLIKYRTTMHHTLPFEVRY